MRKYLVSIEYEKKGYIVGKEFKYNGVSVESVVDYLQHEYLNCKILSIHELVLVYNTWNVAQ